jgi:hypothetical protein
MRLPKSDIPPEATERFVRQYPDQRLYECVLNGEVVGQHWYTPAGQLTTDTPLKNGQKHGREYQWDEGMLVSMEPYVEGQHHGLAKQYGQGGKIIGTYRLVHGTGLDIWRQENDDGTIEISEIHTLRDGLPHGYEWWLNPDQRSVSWERHWFAGFFHGIERKWNAQGKLRRGFPKYWLKGLEVSQTVSKRAYVKAAQQDKTLPPFREKDNRPRRTFPPEIQKLLSPAKK